MEAWPAAYCRYEGDEAGVVSKMFWLHQSEVRKEIVEQLSPFC